MGIQTEIGPKEIESLQQIVAVRMRGTNLIGFNNRAQAVIEAYNTREGVFQQRGERVRPFLQSLEDSTIKWNFLVERRRAADQPLTPEARQVILTRGDFQTVEDRNRVLLDRASQRGRSPFIARLYKRVVLGPRNLSEELKTAQATKVEALVRFNSAVLGIDAEFKPALEQADNSWRDAGERIVRICDQIVASNPDILPDYFKAVPGREQKLASVLAGRQLYTHASRQYFPEFASALRAQMDNRQVAREFQEKFGDLIYFGLPPSRKELRRKTSEAGKKDWQKFLADKIVEQWEKEGLKV